MSFTDALNMPEDDPLKNFDRDAGDDLSAFDAAEGKSHIPAGWYVCRVTRGELVPTKKGKTAFRVTFDVADGQHVGFRLWKWYVLTDPDPDKTAAFANRAKIALSPLGLRTQHDLRRPFPGIGRAIIVRALVTEQPRPDGLPGNDVERFEVVDDRTTPPNPHAIDPTTFGGGEGGPHP